MVKQRSPEQHEGPDIHREEWSLGLAKWAEQRELELNSNNFMQYVLPQNLLELSDEASFKIL